MNNSASLRSTLKARSLLCHGSDTLNLVDLSKALARVYSSENIELTNGVKKLVELIGFPDHLVFILADGLGMNFVDAMDESRFIRKHTTVELQTVFPSTTSAALTTLATGEWPNKHAVIGWFTYLPEHEVISTILHFKRSSDQLDLSCLGIRPEQVFLQHSLLTKVNRNALSLLPSNIVDSVYSNYFSGSSLKQGYESLSEAIDITIRRIRNSKVPTFTYVYTPNIDSVAHKHGTRHHKTWSAIATFESELERLAMALQGEARLVVSADHGLLDANRDKVTKYLIGEPWGDARVMYFNVLETYVAEFCRLFTERFEDRFLLITVEEAESLELLGPGEITDLARGRMGNIIAVSTGADVIAFCSIHHTKQPSAKASHHSGLTQDEMRIPLIII